MVTGRLTVLSPPDRCTDTTLRSDIDPNTSKTLVSCRYSNNSLALFIASYTTKPSIQGGAQNDDLRRLRNGWVRGAGRRTRQSSDVAAQSMLRLMAAVEPGAPIPTAGEVPDRGTVPTAAAAEAARQTLSAPAPPVVAVTAPYSSNVGVPAKAATAAMSWPSPSGAQAEQLPPAHAEPANFAQSSSAPQVPQVLTPQRVPAQPAAHLRAAPRHRALASPRELNTVLTDRFEYSFESALYCNSFESQLQYYL